TGYFGFALALSADGGTALIAAPNDSSEPGYGAVWVLTRAGSAWTAQGRKLSATPVGALAAFGSSVALSADGGTALVASSLDNRGTGSVAIFRGSPMARQGPKLTGNGELGLAEFGLDVALSADGTIALVGAPFDLGHTGAAWVFRGG